MNWFTTWLFGPALSDVQRDVVAIRNALPNITTQLKEIKTAMAADRDMLAQIADGLTTLATPVTDLIASEAALRTRVAELEGAAAADEAGDLEAAGAVKTAFDNLASKFQAEPEVPDVEPLPELPTEGGEPTPAA